MIGAVITAVATIVAAVIATSAVSDDDGKPAAPPGPPAITSTPPPAVSPSPSLSASEPVQSLPVQSPAPTASKNARIEASPDTGAKDTLITVTGSGFAAGERVRITFHGSYATDWDLRDVTASADGGFVAEIRVPAEAADDQQKTVEARGLDSNRRADTPFTVTE